MPNVAQLQKVLPYDGFEIVLVNRQDDTDIISSILDVHNEYAADYDIICNQFDKGDVYDTGKAIWEFLKYNFKYTAEDLEDQTVRSPYRILDKSLKIDCKHYSLFIGGVLDAIKRKRAVTWNWGYCFASYNHKAIAGHVFVIVIEKNGNEIWIDPVLDAYDKDYKPNYALVMVKE